MSNSLKEQLVEKLEQLPEARVEEVLDFVEHLLGKDGQSQSVEKLDVFQDPILKFIGGVSTGTLAKDIDKDLYRD
jgi:Protein of unknown function (DUF2281)